MKMAEEKDMEKKETGKQEETNKTVSGKHDFIAIRPAADVIDEYDGMEINFELPGVSAENVELEVKNRLLTLKAPSSLHRRGLPVIYKRAFYLSDAVDADHITAKIAHGILTLFLPKSESAKAHKIPVE
jgi:HSP20 family protein